MRHAIIIFAMLTTITSPAFAADIQPGLWEMVLETQVSGLPDSALAPSTTNQCLSAQDAQDPSRVLGSAANPGTSDCTFTEKNMVGDTLRFKMQCAGTLGMQTQGEITYSATSMEGRIVSTANMMGQATELRSKITAHRLGDC